MLIEGSWIPEADRFLKDGAFVPETGTFDLDPVRATHFRCTRRRLREHPSLWAYARDLCRFSGVFGTVDQTAILRGYYRNDGEHNPYGIVAEAPATGRSADHNRARLGPARVRFEDAGPATVEAGECERAG